MDGAAILRGRWAIDPNSVMPARVAGIHDLLSVHIETRETWMAGTSPAMTACYFQPVGRNSDLSAEALAKAEAYCADRPLNSAEYAIARRRRACTRLWLFRPTRCREIGRARDQIGAIWIIGFQHALRKLG
jgi:hypothetical protein